MATTAKLRAGGYGGDTKGRKIGYVVTEGTDEQSVIDAIDAVAPTLRNGLVLNNISCDQDLGGGIFYGSASYSEAEDVPTPPVSSSTYTFNAAVESTVYYRSENQIEALPASWPSTVGGMVGIELDGGQGRWSGLEVPAGPITDSWSYEYPNAVIPNSYRASVMGCLGKTNNAVFQTFAIGTCRLIRVASAVTSGGRQTVSFDFAVKPDRTNVKVGSQTITNLAGWDQFWTVDSFKEISGPAGEVIVIPEPLVVYVERLVERADFSVLGIT